ncbi:MAG: ribonuclease III [Acidiferrobacterales bacterium]
MSSGLAEFCRQLNYEFRDLELLECALTHSSKGADNYERLEFLGDSVLNFAISAALYERYPDLSEGELTRLRASLVKKETLARLARQLRLGDHLRLGAGELKSGGFERDSILADALEAVFGAIFLDTNIDHARSVILAAYRDVLADVTPETLRKDPKTQLQEYLQKRLLATPVYNIVAVTGEAHEQTFHVECVVPGLEQPVQGSGKSRRTAEQEAATTALKLLAVHPSA